MKEKKKINPIAEQSKNWLLEALIELMHRKPYNQITISEIAEKAQLGRRTFYRNFNSKEDILEYFIKQLINEYINMLKKETDLSTYKVAMIYFSFWNNHTDFLLLMKENDLLYFILQKYNQYLPFIHEMFADADKPRENKAIAKYIIRFAAGGFWSLLIAWVDEDMIKAPAEMANIVSIILNNNSIDTY